MTRLEAWVLHASNALVGGTGLVYAWMRYALEPQDPFAVVNHPLQPLAQHLHVLLAPVLVFAIGLIWQGHVGPSLRARTRPRRSSGLTLVLLAAPMVASGYLLQTAEGDGWRRAWIAVHLSTSAAWLAAYLTHLLVPKRTTEDPPVATAPARHGAPAEGAAGAAQRAPAASGTRG